jgi:hypothetical protein
MAQPVADTAASNSHQPMDKTDLSLILAAFAALSGLGLGLVAAVVCVAFIAGMLVGQHRQARP